MVFRHPADSMHKIEHIAIYKRFSRQVFDNENVENHENARDKILNKEEIDILTLNRFRREIKQYPLLSKILEICCRIECYWTIYRFDIIFILLARNVSWKSKFLKSFVVRKYNIS